MYSKTNLCVCVCVCERVRFGDLCGDHMTYIMRTIQHLNVSERRRFIIKSIVIVLYCRDFCYTSINQL